MKVICVDDEALILQLTVSMCRELPDIEDAQGFATAAHALKHMEDHRVDLALLDIDMPGMNGIALAREIKERQPDAMILFVTGYDQWAVEAFALHATGYLLKPISRERLAAEVAYAQSLRGARLTAAAEITVRTFGPFQVLVGGREVAFDRSKARELLAYLVDRQGGSVTRAEAFTILWEDLPYERPMQKQLDVVIRSLRKTLADYGISRIMEVRGGSLRVLPEHFDCDLYRFLKGDAEAVNVHRGEYLTDYEWAALRQDDPSRGRRRS